MSVLQVVYNQSNGTERKARNVSESGSCGESWNELMGVMSVDIPLDQLRERLALPVDRSPHDRLFDARDDREELHHRFDTLGPQLREKLGTHAHAFLVDRNGYLLAHPLVDHTVRIERELVTFHAGWYIVQRSLVGCLDARFSNSLLEL